MRSLNSARDDVQVGNKQAVDCIISIVLIDRAQQLQSKRASEMSVTRDQIRQYISEPMSEDQITALIERWIDPDPRDYGVSDARLKRTGTSVAAIISDLEAENGDVGQAAQDFVATHDEILAAVFFYWRHKEIIDAEIALRRSGFLS